MKRKIILILFAIVAVIVLPFLLRRPGVRLTEQTDDTVVIVTPHNEAIRLELEVGFREWYQKQTGRTVNVDWRAPGSTGNIIRLLNISYENAFKNHWTQTLQRPWTHEIQSNYNQESPKSALGKEAREAFLASNVGCGMDLFFGGAVGEYRKLATAGLLVPCDLSQRHPEWFNENVIPKQLAGDSLYDPDGKWMPAVLSTFGIMYNTDRLQDLNIEAPQRWDDLAKPGFYHQIAMVDPVQSSVVVKCFEMLLQQQMQQACDGKFPDKPIDKLSKEELRTALNLGWARGLQLIQKIMANARYFTDNSIATVWDVSQGNCTAGVVVNFYGYHQRAETLARGGKDRVRFIVPKNGACWSPDPIGLLRGAPNREVAQRFIEYIHSEEGQDRMGFKLRSKTNPSAEATSDETNLLRSHQPIYHALHRTPVRKDFYTASKKDFQSAPDTNPYNEGNMFIYRADWTGSAFGAIRFLSKVLFMHPYTELTRAWKAIFEAQKEGRTDVAERALSVMTDFHELTYDWISETYNPLVKAKNTRAQVELETELTKRFCRQYKEAFEIATEGK